MKTIFQDQGRRENPITVMIKLRTRIVTTAHLKLNQHWFKKGYVIEWYQRVKTCKQLRNIKMIDIMTSIIENQGCIGFQQKPRYDHTNLCLPPGSVGLVKLWGLASFHLRSSESMSKHLVLRPRVMPCFKHPCLPLRDLTQVGTSSCWDSGSRKRE